MKNPMDRYAAGAIAVAGTPGSAVLAVDDVILGAMTARSGAVPLQRLRITGRNAIRMYASFRCFMNPAPNPR